MTGRETGNSSMQTKIAVMANDITYLKDTVRHIDEQVSDNYVTKAEFNPVQKLVYGVVTLILIAVIGAVISLVIKQ